MRAIPRLPRQPVGVTDDCRPRRWSRAKVLPLGITLLTLAMLVAFGLPVNANGNGWAGSGKRVGYGSGKSAKVVRHSVSAGRIASAAPVVGAAAAATTVAANIPTTTAAPVTTAPSTTSVAPTTTRAAAVTAAPTTPAPTAPPATAAPAAPGSVCSALGSAASRQSLLDQVSGYARVAGTTGAGQAGATFVVTTTADHGAGSLREGLQAGNRWVVFSPAAFPVGEERVIHVETPIMVGANTTLDGRCANVRLDGSSGTEGIVIIGNYGYSGTSNVMVSTVQDGPVPGTGTDPSGDGIRVVWGTDRCFPSPVEVFAAEDEAIEITRGDRGLMRGTVANSLIRDTQKAVLVGDGTANNEKQGIWATNAHPIQVTFRDNWFLRNQTRNPLVYDSTAHIYNNYVSSYGIPTTPENGSGIELGGNAWAWAESNVVDQPYGAGDYCGLDAVDYSSLGVTGISYLTSIGNAFRGIAKTCAFGGPAPAVPAGVPYAYAAEPITDGGTALIARLTSANTGLMGRAGWVAIH